jgi:Mce-associated membrane protein
MATATATDTIGEVTADEPGPQEHRSPRFRLVLLVVLVIALLGASTWAVVLGTSRHVLPFSGAAGTSTVQADREAAMAATQQFVLRVNTYGPSLLDGQGQMPAYRSRVKAVITPKFAASFDQTVPVAERTVKSYGLDRTCAVFSTGVEVIDSDSAQVLVAGSISQTVKNRRGKRVSAGEPAPFRLRVSLDKIDGSWLVDDYQPVTGR